MTQPPRFASPISFILIVCALMIGGIVKNAHAQSPRSEYRAFWVDTFNTALNNHDDVVAVVNNARAANANAIFAQVRRRGDAWYLNSLEPLPDGVAIAPGFDPLQDLITEAHAGGIEVHAFVIIGAIWNRHPTTLPPPVSPDHVFNRHGFNQATGQIYTGRDNWLTRTLLPDGSGITFQGHRFGSDFWIDLGHPDAAAETADVLLHLVRNYDVDGLHLDRIRYPEFTATGQTPANGINIGYNETSVARFQQRYRITPGSPPPATNDPRWVQWRRDQVTNFVRRVYLNAIAIKPQIKVSAALIAFGGIGATESAWNSAEAYWRVYQDWRAWTEEGILDLAIPMNYKREHDAAQATQYNQWNEWTKNHQYNRAAIIGQGAFLNAIEGTLRQTRRALEPSSTGQSASGVIFFSMATSNVAVTANPFSLPPGQNTPVRPFAEFAAGLTTGKSLDGATLYEPAGLTPIFAEPANIPTFAWKTAPTRGHVMGFAKLADDSPFDAADVGITNLTTGQIKTTVTDGGGFYGGVDLAPGQYVARAKIGEVAVYSAVFTVAPGAVTIADLRPDPAAPATTATLSPASPDSLNNSHTSGVTVTLDASDNRSGVAATYYSIDNGATWQPSAGSFVVAAEGTTTILYLSMDRAGNAEETKSLSVSINQTAPE